MKPTKLFFVCSVVLASATRVDGFSPAATSCRNPTRETCCSSISMRMSQTPVDAPPVIDPKDAVRLFGRLAEKYIMLDASGGLCCYSACKDCEFRNPDGSYIMADQSAARPKWIPVYEERVFENLNKEHVAKWKTDIFSSGPSVTKEEFVQAIENMDFATPLGGPFVSKSAGKLDNFSVAEKLFEVLSDGKEKLSRHKMSVRLRELSGGEEGLTWPNFASALGLEK